ncbi:unnamed protein product, partial [Mycena citricolor]
MALRMTMSTGGKESPAEGEVEEEIFILVKPRPICGKFEDKCSREGSTTYSANTVIPSGAIMKCRYWIS